MHTVEKEYRRLIAAFERIFGAKIFFGTGQLQRQGTTIQRSRFNFMREAQIWYSREHPDQRILSSGFENVIVLSGEFYQEWMAHPVPNDLEAIKCWPHYLPCWTYGVVSDRCFAAKGMKSRPLFGDFGLASQIGTTGYSVAQAVPRDGRAVARGDSGTLATMSSPSFVGWTGNHHQPCCRSPSDSKWLRGLAPAFGHSRFGSAMGVHVRKCAKLLTGMEAFATASRLRLRIKI